MSIQPLSNSWPVAEPAPPSRRAVDRDAGGDAESFQLPRDEPAETRKPAQDSASQPARSSEETRSTDENASDGSVKKPESESTSSANGTESTAGEKTGSSEAPAKTSAGSQPAASHSAPTSTAGALLSIAIAEQAGGQPVKPGQGEETTDQEASGQAASGKILSGKEAAGGKASGKPNAGTGGEQETAEAKPEGVAILDGLTDATIALATPPAAPVAQALQGAAQATGAAARKGAIGEVAKAAGGSGQTAGAQLAAGGGHVTSAQAPAAEGGKTAASDAGDKAGAGQGTGSAAPSTSAEFKALEALQQPLNAIDPSSLNQQGGIKPDVLRTLTASEQSAAQASGATSNQPAAQGQPTPVHVLPIEIGLRALAGARQFDIRLDPGELGRVDVSLSISGSGEVSAKMVVDRVETLHLLQRDSRTLERAFEQAGLKPSDAGVDITLRDPSDQSGYRQQRQEDDTPQRARAQATGSETGDDTVIPEASSPVRRFVRLGGVDMSV